MAAAYTIKKGGGVKKKFSWAYVKQNPVMFGAIFVVFGLVFWVIISRGGFGGGGGSTASGQIVQTGPTDTQVAAATQVQLAQIQAATQTQSFQAELAALSQQGDIALTMAEIEAQLGMAELATGERVANREIEAQENALAIQVGGQLAAIQAQSQFQLDYAQIQSDSALQSIMINASLQRDLADKQLEGFKFSSSLGAIGQLKKKDRDNFLHALVNPGNAVIPQRLNYNPSILARIA